MTELSYQTSKIGQNSTITVQNIWDFLNERRSIDTKQPNEINSLHIMRYDFLVLINFKGFFLGLKTSRGI